MKNIYVSFLQRFIVAFDNVVICAGRKNGATGVSAFPVVLISCNAINLIVPHVINFQVTAGISGNVVNDQRIVNVVIVGRENIAGNRN